MTLAEDKWQKFLKRVWLFRFIPFIDFVLAAGSLATGNLHENSDFDVIVGVREGRIFTVRMFCWIAFGMFGWRAQHPPKSQPRVTFQYFTLLNGRHPARDKVCFNHFITPAAYRLSPPYNDYWRHLYKNLVPICGDSALIQKFYHANADWAGPVRNSPPIGSFGPRWRAGVVSNGMGEKNLATKCLEWILGGNFGDWLENKVKKIQINKINKNSGNIETYRPRLIVSDRELEFHPNTKRTEEIRIGSEDKNF